MVTVGLVKRPGAWYERGGVGLGLRVAAAHSGGTDAGGRHTGEHSAL